MPHLKYSIMWTEYDTGEWLETSDQNRHPQSVGGDLSTAIIGGLIDAGVDIYLGWENRRHQARENQKDRDFNAAEAEKNRLWQEQQYQKYESPAAQLMQRLQAGLSPSEQISSMSVGSGSTASSSSSSLPPISADLSFISQLPSIIANVKNTNADTELKRQEAEAKRIDNERRARDNKYEDETYTERVEQFKEQLKSLKLQNTNQERLAEYEADAYYEDGKLVRNPKKLEYQIREFEKTVLNDEANRIKFTGYIRDIFNVDLTILPDYLKQHATNLFWDYVMNEKSISSQEYAERIHDFNNQVQYWLQDESYKHQRESAGDFQNLSEDLTRAIEDAKKVFPGFFASIESWFN